MLHQCVVDCWHVLLGVSNCYHLFIHLLSFFSQVEVTADLFSQIRGQMQVLDHENTVKPSIVITRSGGSFYHSRYRIVALQGPATARRHLHDIWKDVNVQATILSERQSLPNRVELNSKGHVVADLGDLTSPRFATIKEIDPHGLQNSLSPIEDLWSFSSQHEGESSCHWSGDSSSHRCVDIGHSMFLGRLPEVGRNLGRDGAAVND